MLDAPTPSSSGKKVHLGKAATSPSSLICVTSYLDDTSAPTSSSILPASTRGKKHIENINKVGKEVYFGSRGYLKVG